MADTGGFRPDVAIVLSGGGALAAYEAGVMRAILGGETQVTGYQILDPGIVTGTSAGGLNAALMISRLDCGVMQALDDLDRIWLEELASPPLGGSNGVFRYRLDPMTFLNPAAFLSDPLQSLLNVAEDGASLTKTLVRHTFNFLLSTGSVESRAVEFADLASLISIAPLHDTLRRVLDLNALQQTRRSLRVAATNWTDGRVKVFRNEDLIGDDGYLAIQGSAAIPGIFPPVTIGTDTYVDGGLIMNTPLKPAIDAGASELHVIYIDPQIQKIPTTRLEGTLDIFLRSLAITFASTTSRDIEVARLINEGIRMGSIKALQKKQPPKLVAQAAARLEERSSPTPLRPLTIHRYHPSTDLGSGMNLLDFSRGTVRELMNQGFEDGIRHDCAANNCLLA